MITPQQSRAHFPILKPFGVGATPAMEAVVCGLEPLRCLDSWEGLLLLGRFREVVQNVGRSSSEERQYLAHWVDYGGGLPDRWLLFQLSPADLDALERRELSLLEAHQRCLQPFVLVVDGCRPHIRCYAVALSDIPEEYRPFPGAYLGEMADASEGWNPW